MTCWLCIPPLWYAGSLLPFFSHDYGYSRFQTVAITKAVVMVMATIGYNSRNKQTSWSSMTGLQLTEPWQHYY